MSLLKYFNAIRKSVFYVRPSSGSYGVEDGLSYDTAWSGFSSIDWGLVENNILAVCGTHTEQLNIGASNVTIIGNDPNEAGVIDLGGLSSIGVRVISDRTNITIYNLTSTNATTSCFSFETASSGRTFNCVATNSGNQGFQHLNTANWSHYDLSSSGNVDDGVSAHDSATINIYNPTFSSNGVHVNTIDNTTVYVDNATISNAGSTADFQFLTNDGESLTATIENTSNIGTFTATKLDTAASTLQINLNNVVANSVGGNATFAIEDSIITTLAVTGTAHTVTGSVITTFSGSNRVTFEKTRFTTNTTLGGTRVLTFNYCLFENGTNHLLDIQSGAVINIHACVFYSMNGGDYAIVQRSGSTVTASNLTFVGSPVNVGLGISANSSTTYNNIIFKSLQTGISSVAGTQVFNNCCFDDNTTDSTGTLTLNNEVIDDPLLIDTANLDFGLQSGSPCRGAGTTLSSELKTLISQADWGDGSTVTPIVVTAESENWNIGAYV